FESPTQNRIARTPFGRAATRNELHDWSEAFSPLGELLSCNPRAAPNVRRAVERAMRRVAITGLGVVAPNGIGKEAFWDACVNGRSGVGPIRTFDASAHPVRIAAEVPDFDMNPFVPGSHRKSLKIMGRAARFGVAA